MKRFVTLTVFPDGTTADPNSLLAQVPLEVFNKIAEVYPEGRQKRSFRMYLPVEDRRAEAVRNEITNAGYFEVGPKSGLRGGKNVVVAFDDIYEREDFDKQAWYQIMPSIAGADYASRDEQGRIRNLGERDYTLSEVENAALLAGVEDPRGKVPKRLYDEIASVPPYALILGKRVADAAISAGFQISTKPTTVPDILELTADFVFPPLSPACDFRDPKGQPVSSDMPRLCGHLADGFIQDPLLKYNRTDVMRLLTHGKVVDVAQTRERFGNAEGVSEPLFIISKRFTEWLMTIDGKLRWKPVELI